jgi:hypothetical protein
MFGKSVYSRYSVASLQKAKTGNMLLSRLVALIYGSHILSTAGITLDDIISNTFRK